VTPLSLWGGDTLIYRSVIALSCVALPLIAGVNWLLRGTVSWPQLALAAALLATGLLCYWLSRIGKRDIAAAMLIGMVWIAATIYAIESGYGMHSAAIFMYLPCALYSALFFGLLLASIEVGLTIAMLVLMYLAEESGRLGGAAAFVANGTNFNFLLGVIITTIGTLIAGVVYHRRVEREAARVVAEAGERRIAMEQAQLAQAQLETANARLQALNAEICAQARKHEQETVRARRDLDLYHDVLSKDLPRALQASRAILAAKDANSDALLLQEIGHMESVIGALGELGRSTAPPLQRAPVDLSALARDAIKQLRAGGRYTGVLFDVDATLRVEGDRQLLAALLRHLLKRSASACQREPEPQVHVGTGSREGRRVYFVLDNGPGLDEAQLAKLFRPFARSGSEDDTVDIGIVSARRIVEGHGGELHVDTAPGRGTMYYFTLSAAAAD
jgi:signal transduction histidine kinase